MRCSRAQQGKFFFFFFVTLDYDLEILYKHIHTYIYIQHQNSTQVRDRDRRDQYAQTESFTKDSVSIGKEGGTYFKGK